VNSFNLHLRAVMKGFNVHISRLGTFNGFRHASLFKAGSVTFVGEKETGNMLRSYLVDIHGGYYGI